MRYRNIGRLLAARLFRQCAVGLLLLGLFGRLLGPPAFADVQYTYDLAGRIAQAIYSDGTIVEYRYDANGNLTAINRLNASSLSIATFSPVIGQAGTVVTVLGSGFSPTPGENLVTVGGVAASVSNATASQLTITVPLGAVNAPIAVTVAGNTAVSSQQMIVRHPTITNFSPQVVDPGTAVTVNGTYFTLLPGTTVAAGSTPVTPSLLTNTQAVFAAPAMGSGPISILTSYGTATSATDLLVLPPAVPLSEVMFTDKLTSGSPSTQVDLDQPGKQAVIWFDGEAGQLVSLQVSSLSITPSNGRVDYKVYSPTNSVIANHGVAINNYYYNPSIHLPALPASGRYAAVFSSSGTAEFTVSIESSPHLQPDGTSVTLSSEMNYQSKRFTFSAATGESLSAALTNLANVPASANLTGDIYKPDGTWWTSMSVASNAAPGGQHPLVNVAMPGTYSIVVRPNTAAIISFAATLTENLTGELTSGTPLNLNLEPVGRNASLTFSATAGQTVALNLSSVVTTPAGKAITTRVYSPTGALIAGPTTALTVNLPNLAASGIYRVLIIPVDAATATMQVNLVNGLTGVLPIDGTTANYSTTVPGQYGYFTFSGTADQAVSLALNGLSFSPTSVNSASVEVYRPNGTWWLTFSASAGANPGSQQGLPRLPSTGAYRVIVKPNGAATMSFGLTMSENVSGELLPGTPFNLNLDVLGRNASLTFTASAGQSASINLASVATSPAGKAITTRVYNPSFSLVAGPTTSHTINLSNLPAGTYTVVIIPADAAPATMQVTLQ